MIRISPYNILYWICSFPKKWYSYIHAETTGLEQTIDIEQSSHLLGDDEANLKGSWKELTSLSSQTRFFAFSNRKQPYPISFHTTPNISRTYKRISIFLLLLLSIWYFIVFAIWRNYLLSSIAINIIGGIETFEVRRIAL